MKKFLSRCNRGLILALIALYFLVMHEVYSTVSFKSEKSEIYSQTKSYFTDILASNQNSDINDEYKTKVKNVLDKYWSYNSTLNYSTTKANMDWNLNDLCSDPKKALDITDSTVSLKDVKIKKIGPEYAQLTGMLNYKISGKSNSYYLGVSTYDILDYENAYEESEDPLSNLLDDRNNLIGDYKAEICNGYRIGKYQLTVRLHKEKDKWLITDVDATEMDFSFISDEK